MRFNAPFNKSIRDTMIKPLSQITNTYPSFKNKKTEKFNPLARKQAESIHSEMDFFQKVVEQNERQIILDGIQTLAMLSIAFLVYLKVGLELTKKKNNHMPALIRKFESLKEQPNIPTLENCKSINKDLKNLLQNQINLLNANQKILSEAGEPVNSNRLLLYGPPGVGKSYFAKIFAKTIDAEYMEVMHSDINSMWAGEGVDNMKKMFVNIEKTAKKNPDKKYVVVFNEIDAMVTPADKIASSSNGTHWVSILEERSVFLNYLEILKEKTPNVTIIGTTNISPKNNGLDRAAMSRFQNLTEVSYPDSECLYEALKMNLNKIKDKKKFISDNEKHLQTLAQNMAERKFSFRNMEFVLNEAKAYHLNDKIKDKNNEFKYEYLKKAFDSLKLSDGELETSIKP